MNIEINCPSCNEIIKGEKFDFRPDGKIAWHKPRKSKIFCPHCGKQIEYDKTTKIYVYIIIVALLITIILALFDKVPMYTVFLTFLFIPIFWRKRKLCVYKET